MIVDVNQQPLSKYAHSDYVIVNPVNLEGAMGAGISLWFRNRFPIMYQVYKQLCEQRLFVAGRLLVWQTDTTTIVNLPTKDKWSNPSDLVLIRRGLRVLEDRTMFQTVVMPKIGCGLGGLQWKAVYPYVEELTIPVIIAEGRMDPKVQNAVETNVHYSLWS